VLVAVVWDEWTDLSLRTRAIESTAGAWESLETECERLGSYGAIVESVCGRDCSSSIGKSDSRSACSCSFDFALNAKKTIDEVTSRKLTKI
jgi:hypothetical protein